MQLEYWDELNARLHKCTSGLARLPRHTILDCRRMSDHVHNLLSAADHERVNCRRRRFVTLRFEHLMQQAQEALQNLEGHVILATLMRKDS
jgi:REP element-mobilizing transposase RayT